MAIIRKAITGLNPNSDYIFTLKPRNVEIAATDEEQEVIRVTMPAFDGTPSVITGLELASNFQTVIFKFNPINDKDLDYFEYQLYDNEDGTGDPINARVSTSNNPVLISGNNYANVFLVSVDNSSVSINEISGQSTEEKKQYWGRVRAVNVSGNPSTQWSNLVGTGELDLIEDSFIANLTAAKITAGTIGAHEISLSGVNSVIKSSNYDGTYTQGATPAWSTGTQGWLISGNGQAIFDSTQIRGSISANSINLNAHNYWLPSGSSANFKVGSDSKYMLFDGTNLTFTGALSAATGSFSGNLTASAVSVSGRLTAGTTVSVGVMNHIDSYFKGIDLNGGFTNCFIRGDGGEIYLRADNGSQWIKFENGTVYIKGTNFEVNNTGASFAGSISGSTITGGSISGTTISGGTISVGSNPGFKVNSSGDLDAGQGEFTFTSGQATLRVRRSFNSNSNKRLVIFRNTDNSADVASIEFTSSTNAVFNSLSDARFKNILDEQINGIDIINKIKPVVFTWKDDEKNSKNYGFIAQELYKFIPNAVSVGKDDEDGNIIYTWKVSKSYLVPYLVKAIQELSAKIDELESKIV